VSEPEVSDVERSGGCMCGGVQFRARGEPKRVGVCHCTTCQKNSGSAFLVFAVYPRERVELTGETKSYIAQTGQRLFCPICGSTIGFFDDPDEIDLALGIFDERPGFKPAYELWVGSRHDWLPHIDGLRRYPQNRDGEPLEEA